MALVAYALPVAAAIAITVALLAAYTTRVADLTLTDKFRAAEAIVDGRVPAQWVVQINRRMAWGGLMRLFGRDVVGTQLALAKIDRLFRFYENSHFYENAEARELLLTELRETRERWAQMTWEELVLEHNAGPLCDISGDEQTGSSQRCPRRPPA